jgi:peptide/nickel transport system permease protein
MAEPRSARAGAGGRVRARLARRRAFRGACLGLVVLATLAVYAPFLASDRPLVLTGIHHAELARARRTAPAVADALAGLLARPDDAFPAQTRAAAVAAERTALTSRLEVLRGHLDGAPARGLDDRLERLAAASDATEGAALAADVRMTLAELDLERAALVPRRTYPLLAALTPLESALAAGWLGVLALPFVRRARARRALAAAALLLALVAAAWSAGSTRPGALHPGALKEALTRGEIEATTAVFAPVPFGYAEQHPEESLRPPTWLAASELDARGAYVRGARVPRPDPVTGFVPATRAVDVRAGEPALNSPFRHLLGTDTTGRDLLARILHGARISLSVGFLATALLMGIGVLVGTLSGWFGGVLDLVLSRVIEVVVAFPLLLLVLVAVAFVGPSMWNVVLVIGCAGWTGVARLARAEVLRERELEYVAAARALGFSWPRIVFRHVVPGTLAPLLVAATFAVASAILIEAALSFLGFGVRVPLPSWGALTSESRDPAHWWLQLFPGLFLFATVLFVQLVGDALRAALDPRAEEGA